MDHFLITGGQPLSGQVRISGAKNAALPLIAATLLADSPVTLTNVPKLKDVTTLIKLIQGLGVTVTQEEDRVTFDNAALDNYFAPYDLVKTMRASILVLGPLLARYGKAKVSLPGGCAIGSRPVDQHLKALSAMGANIEVENGYVLASVPAGRLQGTVFSFDMVTVGGTENALIAACLADGTVVLQNCAREPEIVDLANLLIAMGAQIAGVGTSTLTVTGQPRLSGCTYQVVADRIEAGSYLAAAAMTRGDITVTHINPELLNAVLAKFRSMGAQIETTDDSIRLRMNQRPIAIDIRTQPHPAFPTDMQAQLMAVCCIAEGTSTIIENIFENRFMHVPELRRLGAKIKVDGHTAVISGVKQLRAAPVMATDLRASMSLVIAALSAQGETQIDRIYHIDRGYENLEKKLTQLGATITRISG